jgi:hypothetical protein
MAYGQAGRSPVHTDDDMAFPFRSVRRSQQIYARFSDAVQPQHCKTPKQRCITGYVRLG